MTFPDSDFSIEWYSGTGAGGQHRNKHQNSARVTHLPSGQVATAQCRSRINSLQEAKSVLIERLQNHTRSTAYAETATIRKQQVGSGERGDKVRTIRFQDNTVVDHRTNKKTQADRFMKGYIDALWPAK